MAAMFEGRGVLYEMQSEADSVADVTSYLQSFFHHPVMYLKKINLLCDRESSNSSVLKTLSCLET